MENPSSRIRDSYRNLPDVSDFPTLVPTFPPLHLSRCAVKSTKGSCVRFLEAPACFNNVDVFLGDGVYDDSKRVGKRRAVWK